MPDTFSNKFSSCIDLARWFSAFLVVIGHLRATIFVDYGALRSKNIFLAVFYFITGFGHQAVMIFFVLSGLLVGGEVIRRIKETNFNFKIYFIQRFSRLYIVFPLALIAGFIWDYAGYLHFNSNGLYTDKLPLSILNYDISQRLSLSHFFGNLCMLQNIYFPTFGSNAPLWSLTNEFWYYVLFPMLAIILTTQKKRERIIVIIGVCVLSFFVINKLWDGFIIWLLGTSLWFLKKPLFKKTPVPVLIFLSMWAGSRNYLPVLLTPFISDLLVGVSFVVLLNTLWYSGKGESRFARFNKHMAGFSYSIYLLHLPFILFCASVLNRYKDIGIRMEPGYRSFAVFLCILALVYAYSYAIAGITEKNTYRFRIFLIDLGKKINFIK